MKRYLGMTLLGLAALATASGCGADDTCALASSHVAGCLGKQPTGAPSCDLATAEQLLSMSCEQIAGSATGKGDDWWDPRSWFSDGSEAEPPLEAPVPPVAEPASRQLWCHVGGNQPGCWVWSTDPINDFCSCRDERAAEIYGDYRATITGRLMEDRPEYQYNTCQTPGGGCYTTTFEAVFSRCSCPESGLEGYIVSNSYGQGYDDICWSGGLGFQMTFRQQIGTPCQVGEHQGITGIL